MGSRRFAAFLVYTSVLSTIVELVFFNIFFDIERYSGPYPQLGAVLALYHRFTPRLHPQFFGILGCSFSEKSLTYGLCAQVILFGGLSTIVPTFVGFISGILCVNFSENELPELVYTLGQFLGKAIVDEGMTLFVLRIRKILSVQFSLSDVACSTRNNDVAVSAARSRERESTATGR